MSIVVKTDPEARYVFVEGQLNGMAVLLGSVYIPNVAQQQFLAHVSSLLTR